MKRRILKNNIEEFELKNGRACISWPGRLVNLAAGDSHPAEVMDQFFAAGHVTGLSDTKPAAFRLPRI